MKNCILHSFLMICMSVSLSCNNIITDDSLQTLKNRKIYINSITGLAYSGSLIYLNQLWYKPYHTSQFHFFDDNAEWDKMDKCGHFFTAYYGTYYLEKLYRYAGYKHSPLISSTISWIYLLTIEVMDGFSSGWGFSWGDFTANTLGTSFFLLQKQFIPGFFVFKFSYYSTSYPTYNPSLLGKSFHEQILKDYNGQTYWMSVSPFYHWKKNMEWLCLSFGYGINGFIGARSNTYYRNNQYFDYGYIPRQQQFYFSIDIDLSKIKTKKKWLNKIFQSINWIKIPAPALEWKGNNLYFRPLLFSN